MENKITIRQFVSFTNYYVPLYIEDEFMRYECREGTANQFSAGTGMLTEEQLDCPIDYIRNVDGGHFGDDQKKSCGIILGIGIENWEKYFK